MWWCTVPPPPPPTHTHPILHTQTPTPESCTFCNVTWRYAVPPHPHPILHTQTSTPESCTFCNVTWRYTPPHTPFYTHRRPPQKAVPFVMLRGGTQYTPAPPPLPRPNLVPVYGGGCTSSVVNISEGIDPLFQPVFANSQGKARLFYWLWLEKGQSSAAVFLPTYLRPDEFSCRLRKGRRKKTWQGRGNGEGGKVGGGGGGGETPGSERKG